jgi:phosphoribosylaminoimidazole-succinocarboxamide synthase
MEKRERLYEGKAKIVYLTDDPDLLIVEYKDTATAFDGKKKGIIEDKGRLNTAISTIFFELLEAKGIETHLVKLLDERHMLVKKVEILPVEVVVRNIAAGSLSKRLGLEEGTVMSQTILEFYYKSDPLGDPMINDYHIRAMGLATDEEMAKVSEDALKINQILKEFLSDKGIELVDFKLEFGRHKGKIILADEISPDTCRFWDKSTKEKLDKDRFRRDLGQVTEAYQEILKRLSN